MKKIFKQIDLQDQKIIFAVTSWRIGPLVLLFKIFTESARGYAWSIYAIILNVLILSYTEIFFKQTQILWALFCPLLAWFFGKIIKKCVRRKRPYQIIANFKALTHSPIDDSFPSLHAASTSAFFSGLFILHHPYASFVGCWALLVIFSRLYLGVHYLSDLIAGSILGLLCGMLVWVF